MTMLKRTLLALTLASSTAQLAACGSDEPSDGPSHQGDGDGDGDASIPTGDGDAGNQGDGGTTPEGEKGPELPSCPSDPHITADATNKVCLISAPKGNEIKTNLTLSRVKDYKGYVFQGVVYVGEDVGHDATPAAGKAQATLTITPGTDLAGLDNTSGLAINRGSKLIAEGLKTAPITFTSVNALLGTGVAAPTDWGGVVLMGRATQNVGVDPVTELDTGSYGGADDHDNSGSLKYVRVMFSGARSSKEKEFNGITLYAVGDATKIEYVQVHAGSDDGIEFFGGTVNVKHVVISGGGDDNLDWTDGWRGKAQFVLAKQVPNFGDNGLEADNQKTNNSLIPVSEPTLANLTFLGQVTAPGESGPNGFLLRAGTKGHIYSAVATNFKNSCVNVDGDVSQAFVGTDALTMVSSRISCSVSYLGKGEQLFTGSATNQVLPSADVFDNAYMPKADSGLLTGGTVPANDPFFENVPYIGAFGTEDWTAGWTAYPDFQPK
ncbi:MAG: hypothetical protein QM778_10750 [Myxococcales bacterium]